MIHSERMDNGNTDDLFIRHYPDGDVVYQLVSWDDVTPYRVQYGRVGFVPIPETSFDDYIVMEIDPLTVRYSFMWRDAKDQKTYYVLTSLDEDWAKGVCSFEGDYCHSATRTMLKRYAVEVLAPELERGNIPHAVQKLTITNKPAPAAGKVRSGAYSDYPSVFETGACAGIYKFMMKYVAKDDTQKDYYSGIHRQAYSWAEASAKAQGRPVDDAQYYMSRTEGMLEGALAGSADTRVYRRNAKLNCADAYVNGGKYAAPPPAQ